jgi:DNA polymerase III subunit epsilon
MNTNNDKGASGSAGAPHNAAHVSGDQRRVLLPVRTRSEWPKQPAGDRPLRRIAIIDTETTGLDWTRHSVIEVAAAAVLVDDAGRIAAIPSLGSGLNDPGHPLPPEIVELTGLTDAMVANREINRDELGAFLASCEAVLAFNAGFDRSFVEALLPDLPAMRWGCVMADVPWRKLGFETGPQNYFLMQAGRFAAGAHRAKDDVLSLIQLLDHVCADEASIMAKVLAAIDAPAWRFEATWASYHQRDLLRDRRYRWRAEGRSGVWHKHVRADQYQSEWDWHVTVTGHEPSVIPLPATERYRHDRCWKPVERKAKITA